MDEPIQLTRLPSGLTVVTERMDRVETISIGAYVASGSRNEAEVENGVSHFLEHMAFKGTTTRSAAAIAEEVEAVGGHINAYTAREQTAYYVKMLKEDTALGFDIIGDILTHSVFEPEELERERGVILQEIGQANDTPDDIIFDHFQTTAFPNQALGRAVLGSEEAIRGMPRSVLTGYMARNYTNSNVVVAATGKLRHEEVLDLVQRHFGDLPGSAPPPVDDAIYQGGEFREERDLDQVHVVLGFPSVGYSDADYYPTVLLSTLLGGGMSSRLFQEIREKRGLAYSVYSFSAQHADVGLWGIYAGCLPAKADEVLAICSEEIAKVCADGLTSEELERGKGQLRGSIVLGLEDPSSRMSRIGKAELVYPRLEPVDEILASIGAVTLDDVQQVAQAILSRPKALAVVGPYDDADSFETALAG
jgi:predicted Zn-dependent peptidase